MFANIANLANQSLKAKAVDIVNATLLTALNVNNDTNSTATTGVTPESSQESDCCNTTCVLATSGAVFTCMIFALAYSSTKGACGSDVERGRKFLQDQSANMLAPKGMVMDGLATKLKLS